MAHPPSSRVANISLPVGMKILVLGSSGMLGFAIHRSLHDAGYDVIGTLRSAAPPPSKWCHGLSYTVNLDAEDFARVADIIAEVRPTTVVNAIGVKSIGSEPDGQRRLLLANSMLPRLLDLAAEELGIHLIHFSTDGVFSGRLGKYDERCRPDPTDVYSMSKFLGEPVGPHSLVIRTSILGRGIESNDSLVDWLVRQRGTVRGFRRAMFSGLPVNEIGRVLGRYILQRPEPLTGLFNLSSAPICKFDLLQLLCQAWALDDIRVEADDDVVIDRSLNSDRLRQRISYEPPPWKALVDDMRRFYETLDE